MVRTYDGFIFPVELPSFEGFNLGDLLEGIHTYIHTYKKHFHLIDLFKYRTSTKSYSLISNTIIVSLFDLLF